MKLYPYLISHCVAALSAMAFSLPNYAATNPMGLAPYYVAYDLPQGRSFAFPMQARFPPELHVTGGGIDPPDIVTLVGRYSSVQRFVSLYPSNVSLQVVNNFPTNALNFWWTTTGTCAYRALPVPASIKAGLKINVSSEFTERVGPGIQENCSTLFTFPTPPAGRWIFQDSITFQTPVRRRAIDGSEYEASPMVVVRDGVPWITYYFGYRLGLVASESNWDSANLSKSPTFATWPEFPNSRNNFDLAKLPTPFVEGEVVEYVNFEAFPASRAGYFFYAASRDEQLALDQVSAWSRTGRTFRSGGYVPVCRFYGSPSPGPNTHFFSASASECTALLSVPTLHYEGQPFRASLPIPASASNASATCPFASVPLYRLYNNPAGKNYDGNHRYVTDRAVVPAMLALGWVDEGLVMCVPETPAALF